MWMSNDQASAASGRKDAEEEMMTGRWSAASHY